MAKLLKLRRGTTSQHSSFTGAEGEVTIDTDKDVPVVHDGSTAGGHPVAAEDLANVSSSTIVGRLVQQSIPTSHIASGALPTNVTVADANISGNLTIATADIVDDAVTAAKLASNAVVNASVDASAAIAGSKISPSFTSDITITKDKPKVSLVDSGDNPDWEIENDDGTFRITDTTNNSTKLRISTDGTFLIPNNLDANGGIDVSGHITVTGNVDGVDIATRDALFGGLTSSSGVLTNGVTATTQSASDNTTKVATTAYVTTAVSNLVDSAPGALNTLNELAAAMGDDANFSTTVTNSIATKMPLAGGTFTGDVTFDGETAGRDIVFDRSDNSLEFADNAMAKFGDSTDLQIFHNGSGSYIKDTGTGNLELWSNTLVFRNAAGNEVMAAFLEDGTSKLYYDNTQTLETTSSGVTVTGEVKSSTGKFVKDSTDFLEFTDNTRMDITINGNNEFRFEADGDFHADGDVIAFSTTIASDKNLKENIEVIPNALDKVEALRGVTFDWKRDLTPSAGVIAQEVEAVLPEAVKEVTNLKDGGTHLAVNYHALSSILIESIKELSARVKELEAK